MDEAVMPCQDPKGDCAGDMYDVYFWLFGVRGEKTGDLECDLCGAIIAKSALAECKSIIL